ncbi:MAG: TetR/AcrR family transcriptional regulator [Fidelibacterota bacterium]
MGKLKKSYFSEDIDGRLPKRERIIEAATLLFARNEPGKVVMDEIAEKAKVAKGTLYNYFNSKEDLYFSSIRYRLNHLLKLLTEAFDSREDSIENLRSFIVHIFSFFVNNPHFFQIWCREEEQLNRNGDERLNEMRGDILKLLRSVIKTGIRQGHFSIWIDNFTAEVTLGAVRSAAGHVIHRRVSDREKKELREELVNFILSAFLKKETYEITGK